ncbi:hypothetical protein VBZ67_05885 [Campylobacter concisus]
MKKAENLKYLMGLGHFCSDINQSALGAMLPFSSRATTTTTQQPPHS